MGVGAVTEQEAEGRDMLTGSGLGGHIHGRSRERNMGEVLLSVGYLHSLRQRRDVLPGHRGLHQGTICMLSPCQWQPAGRRQVTQAMHLPMMLITLEYRSHLGHVPHWEQQGIEQQKVVLLGCGQVT